MLATAFYLLGEEMNKIELLAPAGDLNKLKTAIDYGADAPPR